MFAGTKEPGPLLRELGARLGAPVTFSTHVELLRRFRVAPAKLVMTICDGGREEVLRDIRELRRLSQVPILALVGDSRTATEALELGADSIAPNPVGAEELSLRAAAILRGREGADAEGVYRDSELELDRVRHRVVARGREVRLTPTEFRLLEALIGRPGMVHRHDDLIEATWGDSYHAREEVKLYVSYLRRKFAAVGIDPIETVRGVGYRYSPRAQPAAGAAVPTS